MISTTFTAVALGAILSTGAVSVPTWELDYGQALATAAADEKPVAVFIGSGKTGYAKLVGGEIPPDAGQMLAKNYVCLYVDTDTAAGKKLAGQFGLSSGLILSCKGGNTQALRHTGSVSGPDLTGYLNQFSDKSAVATTLERGAAPAGYTVPAGQVVYPAAYRNPFGGLPGAGCVGNR